MGNVKMYFGVGLLACIGLFGWWVKSTFDENRELATKVETQQGSIEKLTEEKKAQAKLLKQEIERQRITEETIQTLIRSRDALAERLKSQSKSTEIEIAELKRTYSGKLMEIPQCTTPEYDEYVEEVAEILDRNANELWCEYNPQEAACIPD